MLVLATAGLSKDHLAAVFTKQFFPYAVAIWAATLRGARVTGRPVSLSRGSDSLSISPDGYHSRRIYAPKAPLVDRELSPAGRHILHRVDVHNQCGKQGSQHTAAGFEGVDIT